MVFQFPELPYCYQGGANGGKLSRQKWFRRVPSQILPLEHLAQTKAKLQCLQTPFEWRQSGL